MKRISKVSILAAIIALITLLVYLPALHNNFVEWDDGDYASANPHIRSLNSAFIKWAFFHFSASNWHPLTWISHALDYALWGLNPLGHHMTNIVLHSLNAFLVVVLIAGLFKAFRKREGKSGQPLLVNERAALIAAGTTGLLFGIHPVHVESVAWVAERKDLLCGLFFLLSIILYTNYADNQGWWDRGQDAARIGDGKGRGKTPFSDRYYLATLGFFILALLSKPMAITLPIVLLILDWHPFGRVRSMKTFLTALVEKFPLLLMSLGSSIITVLAQKAGGALSSVELIPLGSRVLVAAKSLIAYLGKMIWPMNLNPFYRYPRSASLASIEYFAPAALVLGITIVCVMIAGKRKIWLNTWGYYCVTLLPVLGIVQVGGQSMADRYTYLPSLGPFLAAGLGMAWLWEKLDGLNGSKSFLKIFSFLGAIGVLMFLSVLTAQQIRIWKNSITLWTYVITKDPTVSFAYNNRGLSYDDMGRYDEAIADFDKAIELSPFNNQAYTNRGMLFGKTGRLDKAIEDFKKAIALSPSDAAAYNNLGIAYARTGMIDEAMEQFNKAILVDQNQAMAYYNRGILYSQSGRADRALSDYRKACELGNNDACNALK